MRSTGGTRRNALRGLPHTTADPGDVSDHRLRECKTTSTNRLSVKIGWLTKLVEMALARQRRPVLELRFEVDGPSDVMDWVIVPAQDYAALHEIAQPDQVDHLERVEQVRTSHASFGITVERLRGMVEQAPAEHPPMLRVYFERLAEHAGALGEWVLLPASDYDALEERAGEAE